MEEEIIHDMGHKEFYCIIEGLKSFVNYDEVPPSDIDIYHTYVPPELRNRGTAARLLIAAADYARSSGKKIVSTCSYADYFFSRHHEYDDIIKKSHE